MIAISMVLVLVGFVSLMLGWFEIGPGDPLVYMYVCIGVCVLAGIFLLLGTVRTRPSRKPLVVGEHGDPSWPAPGDATSAGVIERDELDGLDELDALDSTDETPFTSVDEAPFGPVDDHAVGVQPESPDAPAYDDRAFRPVDDDIEADEPVESSVADERAKIAAALAGVAGVGPVRVDKLVAHFGTYERLQTASADALAAVDGVSPALAERIHGALHP